MEINSLNLPNLQNGEHFEFMDNVKQLILQCTPEVLDVVNEYSVFKEAMDDEDKSFNIIRKSADTRRIKQLDRSRDTILSGLQAQVKVYRYHYSEDFVKAAYRIEVLIGAYGYMQDMSYDQETANITNLLQDLFDDKYGKDVSLLGLGEWVRQLEAANNAFVEVMSRRNTEQAERNSFTRLRTARLTTDVAYQAIRNKINAGIIFNGKDKYESFVLLLNTYIARFKFTIAQRKGRAEAKKSEQENEEIRK